MYSNIITNLQQVLSKHADFYPQVDIFTQNRRLFLRNQSLPQNYLLIDKGHIKKLTLFYCRTNRYNINN